MNKTNTPNDRDQRLAALVETQRQVRRRRKLTGASILGVFMVGLSVGLLSLPHGSPTAPVPAPKSIAEGRQQGPDRQVAVDRAVKSIVERIETGAPKLIETFASSTTGIERISDADLLVAMREQGVSIGIVRIGDRTEIAMNGPTRSDVFWTPDDSAQ